MAEVGLSRSKGDGSARAPSDPKPGKGRLGREAEAGVAVDSLGDTDGLGAVAGVPAADVDLDALGDGGLEGRSHGLDPVRGAREVSAIPPAAFFSFSNCSRLSRSRLSLSRISRSLHPPNSP